MSTMSPGDRDEPETISQEDVRGPALRRSQRERILLAMAAIASAEGYAATTIAKLIADAGISRPTFYEHFDGKEACFLAAQRQVSADLLEQVRMEVARGKPAQAADSAVRCLVDFARCRPERARLLLWEPFEAGPAAIEERDRVIDAIAGAIDRAQARCEPWTKAADLPSLALVGAAFWLLAQKLRNGKGELRDLADGIADWSRRYERPLAEHRWRTVDPGPPAPRSPVVPELPSIPPLPGVSGNSGMRRAQMESMHRERILHATALVASRRGWTATSATEIMAEAQIDKRVFYSAFANKQAAFVAAHELGYQQTLAVTARAFFSAGTWPERVWEGLLAATHFHAAHPTLCHLLYLRPYITDRRAIERIDQTHVAFTIFQQEGDRLAADPLDETAMQAVVAAGSEIVFLCLREGRSEQIPLMMPLLAYLCLAPYIGPGPAQKLIDTKMATDAAEVSLHTSTP
jgi:AcrR family transcriptional regulator